MTAGPISFVVADLLVCVGAASAVAALRLSSMLDRSLAFAALALAQMVTSLLIAGGVVGRLDATTVLWVNIALTGPLLITWTASGGRAAKPSDVRRRLARSVTGASRAARRHPWEGALALTAAAALAWRGLVAYVLPPYDYDGLWYHLTTVAGWVQSGDFARSPLNLWSALYPANGELTFAWPVVLTGSDTWVNGVQLGFVVLGAGAVAGLATLIGARVPASVAAGALFVLIPVNLAQTTTNYVDAAITATFLTSLYFVLRFLGTPGSRVHPPVTTRPSAVVLIPAGAAGGFALGTKGAGIVFVAVLSMVLAVGLGMACARRGVSWRTAVAAVAAFAIPVLAVGGFWYARNLVEFDNPLYPVKVQVLGNELFPGKFTVTEVANSLPPGDAGDRPEWFRIIRSWAQDIAPWTHPGAEFYTEEHRNGGFGMQWPWLQLPALGVLALDAASRRGISLRRLLRPLDGDRAGLRYVLLAVAATWALNPYKWWSRWTIALPAAGAVALVTLIQRTQPLVLARAAKGVTLAVVGVSLWYTTAAIPANYGRQVRPAEVLRLADAPPRSRTTGAVFLPDYRWVDSIEDDARIGVVLGSTAETGAFSYFFYPLFGPRFGHDVVPVDAPGPDDLVRRVETTRVDYVFLRNDRPERSWAQYDDRHFRVLSTGQVFSAFEVVDVPTEVGGAGSQPPRRTPASEAYLDQKRSTIASSV